jgi:hypothetical protein
VAANFGGIELDLKEIEINPPSSTEKIPSNLAKSED